MWSETTRSLNQETTKKLNLHKKWQPKRDFIRKDIENAWKPIIGRLFSEQETTDFPQRLLVCLRAR